MISLDGFFQHRALGIVPQSEITAVPQASVGAVQQ